MGDIYLNGIRYGGLSGPPEGDQVYVNPIINQGIKIAEITVNDTTDSLYAPGGVTDVEVDGTSVVSQQGIAEIDLSGKQDALTAGTNISIDSTTNTISATDTTYSTFSVGTNGLVPAPTSADGAKVLQGDGTWVEQTGGTDVEANPSAAATDTLNKIGIDGTVYGISGGGGSGNVDDVYVNGESVLDTNHIAQIKSYKEVTQSQYDALPSSKTSDGILYAITDAGGGGGNSSIVALTQAEYDNLPSSKYTDNVLYLIKHGEEDINIDIFDDSSTITLLNINGINLVNSSVDTNYVGDLEAYEASAGYEGFNIALYNLTAGDSYTLNFDFQFTSAQFFVDNYRTGYIITNAAKYDYDNWTSWTKDNIDRDLILHNHSITFTATAVTMYLAFNLCGCSDSVQNSFTITNLYCKSESVEPTYTNFTMKYNGMNGPDGSGGGGTTVIANPSGEATADLTKIQIGSTIYDIENGGGGASSENKIPYLKSSGAQYIDTGIAAKGSISICTEFFIDLDQYDPSESWATVYCGQDGNESNSIAYAYNQSTGVNSLQYGNNHNEPGYQIVPEVIHKAGVVKGKTFIDNNIRSYGVTSFSSNYNIALFAANAGGSIVGNSKYCLVNCKIWDDDTLVRDFIPTTDNNVPCLLDRVNNTYYYNQGSGADFTYGERTTSLVSKSGGGGGGASYTDVIGTLTAGQTTLTLTDSTITTDSTLDFYTDTFGVNPTNVTVTTGSVTLTFEVQANNIEVKVRVS